MKEFVTPNGKGITIRPARNISGCEICFTSGGELPSILTGIFTSPERAVEKIEQYLNGLTTEETPNGNRKGKQRV